MTRKPFDPLLPLAAIAALLAVVAILTRPPAQSPPFSPEPLLQNPDDVVRKVSSFVISHHVPDTTNPNRTVTLLKNSPLNSPQNSPQNLPNNNAESWSVKERSNHPADPKLVRDVLHGITQLELLEPQTNKPKLLHKLHLVPPSQGGRALLAQLLTAKDQSLLSLLVGKRPDALTAIAERSLFYVRISNDPQSHLARVGEQGLFIPRNPRSWLLLPDLSVKISDVRSVSFSHPNQSPFSFSRNSPENPFSAQNFPDNLKPIQGRLEGAASILERLNPDDVRPRNAVDFSNALTIKFLTFNELSITLQAASIPNPNPLPPSPTAASLPQGGEHIWWVHLSAQALPNAPQDVRALAEKRNKQSIAWAYRIPARAGSSIPKSPKDLSESP